MSQRVSESVREGGSECKKVMQQRSSHSPHGLARGLTRPALGNPMAHGPRKPKGIGNHFVFPDLNNPVVGSGPWPQIPYSSLPNRDCYQMLSRKGRFSARACVPHLDCRPNSWRREDGDSCRQLLAGSLARGITCPGKPGYAMP